MTVKQTLGRARVILADNSIDDASLESELLLRQALGISRVQLYLDLNLEIDPRQAESFWRLIERRINHEPTAYISGHREFYGLDFHVDPNVLIPRPESELLVEKALELAQNRTVSTIADVGTGCGAIAISLALNLPRVKIYAIDISAAALEVARFNCQKHGVEDGICLLESDMLDSLTEPVDLIIANLPYVKESELSSVGTLNYEPALALDGGSDGLKKIRQLCSQVGNKLLPGGCLLLEIGCGQSGALISFLHRLFPLAKIEVVPDMSGIDRAVNVILLVS